jgi:alanine-synthesizing transaminase
MHFTAAKRYANIPMGESTFVTERNALIREYERTGKTWYRLMGADVPLTGHRNRALTNMLAQAVEEGWDYYVSETHWLQEYLEAVTLFESKHRGVRYSADEILAVPGVASGLQLIHNAMFDPGDELVVIEPSHYASGPCSYLAYLGVKTVQVPCLEDQEWEPDLDKLRNSITNKTKAIALDHPNNPTGAIYSLKARQSIIDLAGEYELPIISDEMYSLITFDGNDAASMASTAGDVPVIVTHSFSKFFMMPGWRIGYVCFHDPRGSLTEFMNMCRKINATYGFNASCIPLPILVAATRALREYTNASAEVADAMLIKGPMDESKQMVRRLQARRDFTSKRLSEIKGISVVKSKASLYMFPKVHAIGKTWRTTEDFILELLREEAVGFHPGDQYGKTGFGHFRTMVLNDLSVLEEVYNRLERFLARHSN